MPDASAKPVRSVTGAGGDARPPTQASLVLPRWTGEQRLRLAGACLVSLAVHVGIIFAMPVRLTRDFEPHADRKEDRLEVILEEVPERPDEFVLTNPDVFANPPDAETPFFSNRDQQAAQEEAAAEGDPTMPAVEGEEPEPTQNIVSTENKAPAPPQPVELSEETTGDLPGEAGTENEYAFDLPRERPVSGFEPVDEPDGLDVPVTEDPPVRLEDDPVIGVETGAENGPGDPSDANRGAGADRPVMPRPRPVLNEINRGPVGTRVGAAPRIGQVAVDANFSEYGDYLARMIDVIVRQWHLLAWDSLPAGEVGTVVSVSFQVNASGQVLELEVIQSTASLVATLICQDAIESRQPYGEWSPEMREVLGDEQTIRIRFLYR